MPLALDCIRPPLKSAPDRINPKFPIKSPLPRNFQPPKFAVPTPNPFKNLPKPRENPFKGNPIVDIPKGISPLSGIGESWLTKPYPDNRGFPDHLNGVGYGLGLYEVKWYVDNTHLGGHAGPVQESTLLGAFSGVGISEDGRRYGLKSTEGKYLAFARPEVVLGVSGSIPEFDLSKWSRVVIVDIKPVQPETEKPLPREPIRRNPRRRPITPLLNPSPSRAIPKPKEEPGIGVGGSPLPNLSPIGEPARSPNPTKRPKPLAPLNPSPNPSPLPLNPEEPIRYPSLRPTGSPLLDPAQAPEHPPIAPPHPYLPTSPSRPKPGNDPSEDNRTKPIIYPAFTPSAIPIAPLPGLGNRIPGGSITNLLPSPPIPGNIPNRIPSNIPARNPVPSTMPESAPITSPANCSCSGMQDDEDYMIAKPLKIQVPIVKEVGGLPVTSFKTITIISIRGVSNASDVLQAYQIRADSRRAQINAKNQRIAQGVALGTIQGTTASNAVVLANVTSTVGNVSTTVGNIFTKLTAMQEFLTDKFDKLWKASGADRALKVLMLAATIHNAAMLSRNLGETLIDTTERVLRAIGIYDPSEQPYSLFELFGIQLDSFFSNMIGAENVDYIQEKWVKGNRIISTAANLLWSIQSMTHAAIEGIQVVGGWVARIGNGHRKQGNVDDSAWPWMNPNPNFKNPLLRTMEKIDNLDEAASQINQVASSAVEFQETRLEIIELKEELRQQVEGFITEENSRDATEEQQASPPDIENEDLWEASP